MATEQSLPQRGTKGTKIISDLLDRYSTQGLFSVGRYLMIYIQIPEEHDAIGFLELAKSGTSVLCLPDNIYGVSSEHLTLLRRKRIPFKKLESNTVRLPKPSRPHNDKI
jgi:hypothetical protein